jgi:hypothetical protein
MAKCFVILSACLMLAACWNGGNQSIRLGDVSLGQQLIDLQAALDQGAVTTEEYERLKAALVSVHSMCNEASPQS